MTMERLYTIYLSNAFSLNMLSYGCYIEARPASEEDVRIWLKHNEFVSVVGHEATAQVISQRLGIPVQVNREALKLRARDIVIVFQLKTRLPEGKILTAEEVKNLPAEWWYVRIIKQV